jgi:hypothetical protein
MRAGTAQLNKHRGKLKVREADQPYLKTLLLPLDRAMAQHQATRGPLDQLNPINNP